MGELLLGVVVGGLIAILGTTWRLAATTRRLDALRALESMQVPTLRKALPDLKRELNRARRSETSLSVAVFGLDVGDLGRAGKPADDLELMRMIYLCTGPLLSEAVRDHDHVAYDLATDRFVMVLVGSNKTQAQSLVNRVFKMVAARTQLGLRAGVAQFRDSALTIENLIDRAGDDLEAGGRESDVTAGRPVSVPTMLNVPQTISDRQ